MSPGDAFGMNCALICTYSEYYGLREHILFYNSGHGELGELLPLEVYRVIMRQMDSTNLIRDSLTLPAPPK
jgi:hypothetical protein